ncbi:MAG: DUF5916 domain-containing protein, partial [Vicinamibacterales bacterium]
VLRRAGVLLALAASPLAAQTSQIRVPVAPEVETRDASGRATVRAVRLTDALKVDGRMDEPVYASVKPIGGFTQVEPKPGAPASQPVDVWLLYDQANFYVSVRVHEDHLERMVANEMRRDASINLAQNELVTVALDTFHDRRSSFSFCVNPIGGRCDGQSSNEGQYNGDWNSVWSVQTGRWEGGWTIEMALPFRTLRYPATPVQDWGIQILRINRWKNEVVFLTPSDPSRGSAGFMLASRFANLVGLEAPPPGRNIEVKPYTIGSLTTDRLSRPAKSNATDGNIGLDVKYAVTQSIATDFTWNTDFAQVEADEQQVNLTRFNLFFPEKREFFLENQGVFAFGGTTSGTGGAAGDAPILFYSRSIGLNGAQQVPLSVGGRATGRLGRFSFGGVNIQSKAVAATNTASTNFSVLRMKRDILNRSSIGVMATNRSVARSGQGRNTVVGADATFAFYTNLAINTYWATSDSEDQKARGVTGDNQSYRGQLDYNADRYGLQAEYATVGANFNPEMGFMRRIDMRKAYLQGRFSPRPKQRGAVRKYYFIGSGNYIRNGEGRRDFLVGSGEFSVEMQNADRYTVGVDRTYEYIPRPFVIAPGVTVPVGGYDYRIVRATAGFGQQRRVSAQFGIEHGTLYGGSRTTLTISRGRYQFSPRLAVEPTVSFNNVDLPGGSFNTNLIGSRVNLAITPRAFISALVQYNSTAASLASNVRFRWEYLPGSEMFVVYNDQRDSRVAGFPDLQNRSFIVKINRLMRF